MVKDNTKNARRGRMKDGDDDKPAEFDGGAGAASGAGFDPEEVADEMGLWWENGAGEKYIMEDDDGEWVVWGERKVVKGMRMLEGRFIALKRRDDERLSESDRVLLHVMKERRVNVVLDALAGYKSGVHQIGGVRSIVKTAPKLVDPQPGDWETVKALINNLLNPKSGGHDQAAYFHGWMKMAVESLYLGGPENFRPGQACIFAGPADSGKSRIQHQIVSGLLGGFGRSADPGAYMFGRTDFNGEMFGAEHLLMEDPVSSTLTKDRVFFGEMIKGIVVNDTHRLHRKREDAIMVSPFWRLTISVNDDPDKMRVLPLLTPDMRDKIMLFHVEKCELPMPTETLDERRQFREQIDKELPAYAHYLLNDHVIDPDMVGRRCGIKEFHHPGLVLDLFDDTPAAELLLLVDAAEFERGDQTYRLWELPADWNTYKPGRVWGGGALMLQRLMEDEVDGIESSVAREAKKLFAHSKCERLLARLKEDQPERVAKYRKKDHRGWHIGAPSSK